MGNENRSTVGHSLSRTLGGGIGQVIRLESHLDLEATQKHLHSAIDAFNSHMKPGASVASSETVTEASSRRGT